MTNVMGDVLDGLKSILLVSCYELGHQPVGIASPRGFLQRAGYASETLDIAVESFDENKIARAWFVGISVPMHTALRLGVRMAERIREINPGCHICFYGLYASLNADYLLEHVADSIIGGEYEEPLVDLISALDGRRRVEERESGRRGEGESERAGEDIARFLLPHSPIPDRGRQLSRAASRPVSQTVVLHRSPTSWIAAASAVRAPGAPWHTWSGRLRGSEPGLLAPLSALSDSTGLWRSVLCDAKRHRARGHEGFGAGRSHSHHVRRS